MVLLLESCGVGLEAISVWAGPLDLNYGKWMCGWLLEALIEFLIGRQRSLRQVTLQLVRLLPPALLNSRLIPGVGATMVGDATITIVELHLIFLLETNLFRIL